MDPILFAVVLITSAVLAGLFIESRWRVIGNLSERRMDIGRLMERSRDALPLYETGTKRLLEFAEKRLRRWQDPRDRLGTQALPAWPAARLVCRPVSQPPEETACPVPTVPDAAEAPLLFRVRATDVSALSHDLEAVLAARFKAPFPELEFMRTFDFPPGETPRLWFHAPDLIIDTASDISRCLEAVSQAAANYLRGTTILEVHLARDIIEEYRQSSSSSIHEVPETATEPVIPMHPAAKRVYWRNLATEQLRGGTRTGTLPVQDPNYLTPPDLLATRLPAAASVTDSRLLFIWGPPGCGKTETANLLLRDLHERFHKLVLVCSDKPCVEALARYLRSIYETQAHLAGTTRNPVLRELSIIFGLSIKGEFAQDETSRAVYQECLYRAMLADPARVVIAVDDLDYRGELARHLALLQQNEWGLGFVLIARASFDFLARDLAVHGLTEHRLELWNRAQAQQILTEWSRRSRSTEIASLFSVDGGWLSTLNIYSWYLLRAVAQCGGVLEGGPHSVLRRAIEKHLEPMQTIFDDVQLPISMEVVVARVRELAAAGATVEQVIDDLSHRRARPDIVQLFGWLSWQSRFHFRQDWITAEQVTRYSSKFITNEAAAERFLETGRNQWIFGDPTGFAYTWRDKLVFEGTAALELAQQISRRSGSGAEDNRFAGMLTQLLNEWDSPGSLHLFNLVLDPEVIVLLVKLMPGLDPKTAALVSDKVIAETFVSVMRQRPDGPTRLLNIASSIVERSRDLDTEHVVSAALTLSRLLDDERFRALVAGLDQHTHLAVALRAVRWHGDVDQFITALEQGGIGPPILLDVVFWVWGPHADDEKVSRSLFKWSGQSGPTDARVYLRWRELLSGRTPTSRWRMLVTLLKSIAAAPEVPERTAAVLEHCFRQIFDDEKAARAHLTPALFEQLRAAAAYFRAQARSDDADVIIRWMVHSVAPDFTAEGAVWKSDGLVQYAVPTTPLGRGRMRDILGRFRRSHGGRLAATSELRELACTASGEELAWISHQRKEFRPHLLG